MAALPYMQFYVADYLADTMHLTTEEHGAYLMLIMNYWQTGKPIKKTRLQAITRVPNERWSDVERTLSEFFYDNDTHWQHSRIDADLMFVDEAQEQRSRAGKASAEARKREKQASMKRKSNDRSTPVEIPLQRNANEKSTNKEEKRIDTDKTRIETEIKKRAPTKKPKFDVPPEIPPDDWRDLEEHRKAIKRPMTDRARKDMASNVIACAAHNGTTTSQVIGYAIQKGWTGIGADWAIDGGNRPARQIAAKETHQERGERMAREREARINGSQAQGMISEE